MKVSSCNNAQAVEAPQPFLTWDEMLRTEGVYNIVDSKGKMIVFHGGKAASTCLLYFQEAAAATLVVACPNSWRNDKFIRTNETVCFELKEG